MEGIDHTDHDRASIPTRALCVDEHHVLCCVCGRRVLLKDSERIDLGVFGRPPGPVQYRVCRAHT